ncbi:hypothetical protein SCUP515_12673 [Seiridium cupressi]
MMSPTEVRREAAHRAGKIFANYNLLRSVLERHEATIQKRWEKKSKAQRLAILLEAWPGMSTTHRPDFAALRKHAGNLNSVALQHRRSFMWPSINQEDLTEPRILPLLLNARGRNHPSVFAAVDGEGMHLGKVTMAIVPIFLNELMGWEEHEDAFDWMHSQKQFLPGEGLLILEFQDELLKFLVHCCQRILHEIPLDQMTSDAYAIQPEPIPKRSIDTSGFASLAVLAKEAAYRPPANLDLEKIESLLAARAAQVEDHVWALREDPNYFTDKLLEMKEHRQEMIRDIQGDLHPTLKPGRDGLLWARVIGSVIVESYFQLESFVELRDQAHRLRILQEKHKSNISPQKSLPEEYLATLLKFRHYSNQVSKGALNQLKTSVVASPPLRVYFVRNVPASATSSKIEVMSKPSAKMDKVTRHLVWLLQTLWEDGNDLFLCRITTVIDELDLLLRAEPKTSEMVSPYIVMLIGELSVVGECLRQLEIYQSWANGFEQELVDRDEGIKREFANRTQSWGRVLETFRDQNLVGVRQLGDPSDGKFHYPVGKRENKANVETLRAVEARLDAFCSAVDRLLREKAGNLDSTANKKLLSQRGDLQRTPEWVEPAAKKDQNPKSDSDSPALVAPLSQLSLSPGPPSFARREILGSGATKTKTKSRGTPSAPTVSDEDKATPPPGTSVDLQPTFSVDARALKIFRILFFDPAANTTADEVAWRDFLHAMDSTGFASEKLYGSVWHFQPTKLDVERSI